MLKNLVGILAHQVLDKRIQLPKKLTSSAIGKIVHIYQKIKYDKNLKLLIHLF
jgi:hypothetical protein